MIYKSNLFLQSFKNETFEMKTKSKIISSEMKNLLDFFYIGFIK